MAVKITESGILPLALSIVGFAILVQICIAAFHTPLRNIPGPWYAKFTSLWLKYKTNKGQRMYYIHSLHLAYGPIVRIAPQEIDVADRASYREINRMGSGFVKSSWYPVFRSSVVKDPRKMDLFALVDPRIHADRRKMYAQNFTHDNLTRNWEPYISDRVIATVAKVKEEIQTKGRADIFKWWNLMASEIMGKIAFGESMRLIEAGKEGKILRYIHLGSMLGVLRVEWGIFYQILKLMNLPSFKETFDAPIRFFDYARKAAFNARNSSLQSNNVFSSVLAAQEKNSDAISDDVIAIEAEGLMTGGASTIKNTLVYLVYEVLRRPELQKQLENEVSQLPADYNSKSLETLPVLNAILYETLRYHAAAPGSLRRTSPPREIVLGGYQIPRGTTVCLQAFSLNRDESIYPDAERFEPARFLDATAVQARKSAMATFGGGNRTCIGVHLAYIEMRLAIAAFFREIKGVKLDTGTTVESMHADEYFGIEPHGLKCEITV